MNTTSWKPGEKAPESASYELVDRDGSRTGRIVHVERNDHFPPTDHDGQSYIKRSLY